MKIYKVNFEKAWKNLLKSNQVTIAEKFQKTKTRKKLPKINIA